MLALGAHMAQWNRLRRTLSVILPAGAFGASVLLALASRDALATSIQGNNAAPPSGQGVAIQLQEIRSGISDMTGSATDPAEGAAKASPSWWGNGGWGRWRLGWGNGGWHNGGWGNGGWGNGGWHNGGWGNGGWGNGGWHNGWHNFWHNW
jgi:rSAM-associated Gly-rich repeat protein